MVRKWLEITVQEIAAGAPWPKSFYDRYCDEALEAIKDQWPTKVGVVCLMTSKRDPSWICVWQAPDVGLLESWATRVVPKNNYEIITQLKFEDRIAGLDEARRQVARIAQARANYVERAFEWFEISESAARSALMASVRDNSSSNRADAA